MFVCVAFVFLFMRGLCFLFNNCLQKLVWSLRCAQGPHYV